MNFKAPISDFMSRKPLTVAPRDKMSAVKEIFDNNTIHHVLVVDYTTLVGIISKEDYRQLVKCNNTSAYGKLIEDARLFNYTVEEMMTKELAMLESTERISVALDLFSKNLFSAIPIVDNGEVVGLLTTYDIIKALVSENHSIHAPIEVTN